MSDDGAARFSGTTAREFDLTNHEAELAARERAVHARERAIQDRRRTLAQREASLRDRSRDLVDKASAVDVAVPSEVRAAVDSRVISDSNPPVAAIERTGAVTARERAVHARSSALEAAEDALDGVESEIKEADAILGHRETSVAALAREVIRNERDHLARREARARELAEKAHRDREERTVERADTIPMAPSPVARMGPPPPPTMKEDPSGAERRVYTRVRVDLDVTMSGEHNFFTGFAANISEGGLFIATHEYLPVGTELDVTFRLPNYHDIQTRARVQWLREYNAENDGISPGMGVKFLELPSDDYDAVMAFLRRREPLFFEP